MLSNELWFEQREQNTHEKLVFSKMVFGLMRFIPFHFSFRSICSFAYSYFSFVYYISRADPHFEYTSFALTKYKHIPRLNSNHSIIIIKKKCRKCYGPFKIINPCEILFSFNFVDILIWALNKIDWLVNGCTVRWK